MTGPFAWMLTTWPWKSGSAAPVSSSRSEWYAASAPAVAAVPSSSAVTSTETLMKPFILPSSSNRSRAQALLEVDADVGEATARRAPELCFERYLAIGADADPCAEVGHTVAVDVEGDQPVEPLTGLEVDGALRDPVLESPADEEHLVVGAEHELRPRVRVLLAGVGAIVCQRWSRQQDEPTYRAGRHDQRALDDAHLSSCPRHDRGRPPTMTVPDRSAERKRQIGMPCSHEPRPARNCRCGWLARRSQSWSPPGVAAGHAVLLRPEERNGAA